MFRNPSGNERQRAPESGILIRMRNAIQIVLGAAPQEPPLSVLWYSQPMTSLEEKRHTLAHLLAAAVTERYPNAKPTIGPAIDTGFYYDFDFGSTKEGNDSPKEADLIELERSMREMLPSWNEM